VSKNTTLPIAREIAETYVTDEVKLPWYIDLLNINIDNYDLAEAKKRMWEINPVSGEKLAALAKEVIAQPPEVVERVRKILGE